jgi:hypothetical protein
LLRDPGQLLPSTRLFLSNLITISKEISAKICSNNLRQNLAKQHFEHWYIVVNPEGATKQEKMGKVCCPAEDLRGF